MPSAEHLQLHRSLHQAIRVAQSVGAEATAMLEGYDEGDPIHSIELGRFSSQASIHLRQI